MVCLADNGLTEAEFKKIYKIIPETMDYRIVEGKIHFPLTLSFKYPNRQLLCKLFSQQYALLLLIKVKPLKNQTKKYGSKWKIQLNRRQKQCRNFRYRRQQKVRRHQRNQKNLIYPARSKFSKI